MQLIAHLSEYFFCIFSMYTTVVYVENKCFNDVIIYSLLLKGIFCLCSECFTMHPSCQ